MQSKAPTPPAPTQTKPPTAPLPKPRHQAPTNKSRRRRRPPPRAAAAKTPPRHVTTHLCHDLSDPRQRINCPWPTPHSTYDPMHTHHFQTSDISLLTTDHWPPPLRQSTITFRARITYVVVDSTVTITVAQITISRTMCTPRHADSKLPDP